jgi:hypothetical protein
VTVTRDGSTVLKRARSRKTAYLARRLERLDPDQLQLLAHATELIESLIEDPEEPR